MIAKTVETLLMAASAVLWVVMVGLAGAGHWLAALFVLLGMIALCIRILRYLQARAPSNPPGIYQ